MRVFPDYFSWEITGEGHRHNRDRRGIYRNCRDQKRLYKSEGKKRQIMYFFIPAATRLPVPRNASLTYPFTRGT
jgi:hypothetical protein